MAEHFSKGPGTTDEATTRTVPADDAITVVGGKTSSNQTRPVRVDSNGLIFLSPETARMRILEVVEVASFEDIQTSNSGAEYVQLTGGECKQVFIMNITGVTLEILRNGAGKALPLPDRCGYLVRGLTDANQISIRRQDQENIQVTVNYELEG
jgi:hypothetical protein